MLKVLLLNIILILLFTALNFLTPRASLLILKLAIKYHPFVVLVDITIHDI